MRIRVLFVCHGNICRSTMAEYVMKALVNHKARQMQKHEYDEYDYIIGMDSWNIRNINRIIGNSDPEGKVSKLLDFTEEKGKDIADPWYTGDFDTTYRDVKKGCEALLNDCLLRF